MRNKLMLLATLLLGFALGSVVWLPSVRTLREDLQDARQALAASGPSLFVLSPSELENKPRVREEPVPILRQPASSQSLPEPATVSSAPETPAPGRGRLPQDPSLDDLELREARRQEFSQRVRERADASRMEFVAQAGLTLEQVERFDDLVFELNLGAEAIVNEWMGYIRGVGAIDPDFRVRMMHDLSAVVIEAYDRLDADLPDTWRTAAQSLDLLRMIDPDVWRPLLDLQRDMGVRSGPFMGLFGGRGGPPRGPAGGTLNRDAQP